jgi:S-disulfanyl-L-cysteine oxidoreductase SoxD
VADKITTRRQRITRSASSTPRTRAACAFVLAVALSACNAKPVPTSDQPPSAYGLGQTPTPAQLAALDIDVDTTGHGLPPGQGTAAEGAAVYTQLCASCHGAKGEGIRPAPALIGRTPDAGHVFANDAQAVRTIGNYWPYATTIFDYVRRAMPLAAPGTLTAEQTYAVVAYLLRENGLITDATVINAQSLPTVQMPARKYFVNDNRTGGPGFR